MRIIKPLWLKHGGEKKDFEVYSCHVSADGERLVTAAGDGYIRIWSTEAIYNAADPSYTKPRQLAALNHHSGTIHTVRFSGSNKYLASGADDKIVCVYSLDPNPPTHAAFGSNEPVPVENWRIYRRLIGHENDVQDLGWSYDSSILVSVGLDSRVVVWSGYTFEKLKTLSNHQSHVKGITFDPANKHFATSSDDRTIKIYRYTPPQPNSTAYDMTNNFVLDKSVSAPFTTSPLTTYFRRCSWSPDGTHIAAANAVNGPVSTCAIIERGTWNSEISLIGHEGPLEVCAFCPRIFGLTPDDDGMDDGSSITVIACAGQDRGLSIWNTVNTKPLVVTEALALKAISDIAWSPDGERLFLTSLDGAITLVHFQRGELGYPCSTAVNETQLAKYGGGRKVGLPEGPDALRFEEMSKNDELKNVQGRMGELMGDGHGPPKQDTTQVNGTQPNGVPKPSAKDSSALTNGHTESAETARSSTPQPAQQAPDPKIEKLKQRVTVTKDGRKRVAPLLVSSSAGNTESSLPSSQLMVQKSQTDRNEAPHHVLDFSKPYDVLPKGGVPALVMGQKRKFAETGEEGDDSIKRRIDSAQRQGAAPGLINTPDGLDIARGEQVQQLTNSQTRIALPQRRLHIQSLANRTEGQADETHVFEVKNPSGPSRTGRAADREPARIAVSKRGQMLWQDYTPHLITITTGNSRFWAAACDDGSILIWTPAGRRLFPGMILDSPVSILDSRGPYLLAVASSGTCYVWNTATSTALHPPVSLSTVMISVFAAEGPHLTPAPALMFARLTSSGSIVLAMSNGEAYTWSAPMQVWQRISESWWAVGSQYWNTSDSSAGSAGGVTVTNTNGDPEIGDLVRIENIAAGVIPLIERNTTSQVLLRGKAYHLSRLIKTLLNTEGFEGFEASISIAHLENRLAAALSLGARDEFKLYLSMYAKRLGAEGSKLKVEELLRSLLAGVFEDAEMRSGTDEDTDSRGSTLVDSSNHYLGGPKSHICGWKKETLLKEVVLTLGKYRDLQRITVSYARILGITDEMPPVVDEDTEADGAAHQSKNSNARNEDAVMS